MTMADPDSFQRWLQSGGREREPHEKLNPKPTYDPNDFGPETSCPQVGNGGPHCDHWYDGEMCHYCGDKEYTPEDTTRPTGSQGA